MPAKSADMHALLFHLREGRWRLLLRRCSLTHEHFWVSQKTGILWHLFATTADFAILLDWVLCRDRRLHELTIRASTYNGFHFVFGNAKCPHQRLCVLMKKMHDSVLPVQKCLARCLKLSWSIHLFAHFLPLKIVEVKSVPWCGGENICVFSAITFSAYLQDSNTNLHYQPLSKVKPLLLFWLHWLHNLNL